jgi:hypothetical protein
LPCELPKDASEGFGENVLEHFSFFLQWWQRWSTKRAKITEQGKLTPRFSYLQDFVDGK